MAKRTKTTKSSYWKDHPELVTRERVIQRTKYKNPKVGTVSVGRKNS